MVEKKRKKSGEAKAKKPKPQRNGWKILEEDMEEVEDICGRYAAEPPDTKLSPHDLNECVVAAMRLVLAHNANKPLVPVKYSQIQQLVLRLQAKQKGIANVVIAHAQRRFLRLGWELAQMGSTAANMGFVLRSYLPGSFIAEVANTAQQNAMCALRLQVQLYLHVKGDKCTEEELLTHLAKFGLHLRPMKEQDKLSDGEVEAAFGHSSPLSRLVAERFVAATKEEGAEGQLEEFLALGDAAKGDAAEMQPEEVQTELQDLMGHS